MGPSAGRAGHPSRSAPLPGPAKATLVEVLGLGDRAYDAANIEAIEKAYRRGLKRNGLDLGIDDRHLVDSPGGGRLSAGSGWDQEMLQRVRDEAESRNVPAIRRLTKAWYLLTRTHPQWKRREKKSALYGETYDIFYLRRVLKNVLGISHTDPNFPTNKFPSTSSTARGHLPWDDPESAHKGSQMSLCRSTSTVVSGNA